MRRYFAVILLLLSVFGYAQKNNFNLVLGGGASYFFNDRTLNRHIDHTRFIGLNYVVHTKTKAFSFNPGLHIQTNNYHARVEKTKLVHVNQNVFSLTLDILMKLNKKQWLRVGLFINGVYYTNIFISTSRYNGRNYYSAGNDAMYKSYFSSDFQAGITLGLCFPFRLFNREHKFDIKLAQFASSLVNSDFKMDKDIAGKDIEVLSTKARPTMLIIVLEFNLQRVKKEKKSEEE